MGEYATIKRAFGREPDTYVYNVQHNGRLELAAVFRWARDAQQFVDHAPSYAEYEMKTREGRRIVGVSAHGYAILEKLT